MRAIHDHKVSQPSERQAQRHRDRRSRRRRRQSPVSGGWLQGQERRRERADRVPGRPDRRGAGVNGLTHEALLAIVADRLRSFQAGPYSCKANACALTKIEEAQHWLQQRTLERMRRGVEGTHAL